jgi:segregation and condensation protein A
VPEAIAVTKRSQYDANLYDLLAAYARQRQKQAGARIQLKRRVVWSLAEAREALSRLLGVALDWIEMDDWLISYCVDPKLQRTARASSFSASLEYVREGKLELRQDKAFAPIWVRARPADPPQAA